MPGNNDGSVVIYVGLDNKDYEDQLQSMERKTRSFGSQVKTLLGAVGVTKAVSAGFNILKDSVGAAMSRADTMDQFTRVMTSMTGSSEAANQALKNIKETVSGTAYGLDVAAASTQKFVTSGMDIAKATQQVAIWGDAVAFYGKGTNESYSNVTDAISKMTAKGKVEMDQLNRLTDEGIPAVQIFADATGRSMQDVQNDLSSGKISSEEFLTVLGGAMDGGTKKFASISGAAKDAGASWSGTIDNMRAAVARGMGEILASIDEALSANGLPTMKEMISSVGKTAEEVMGWISDHMPEIISLIKTLVPVIISVGAAFATWEVAGTIGRASSAVSGFLSLSSGGVGIINALLLKLNEGGGMFSTFAKEAIGAKGGIKGLGKAFMTVAGGPVPLIIAAVAAIAAGLIYLWNTSEGFRNFWIGVWDSITAFTGAFVEGIVNFFTVTIPEAWISFQEGLLALCNNIILWFQTAWNSVIAFFVETIPAWIQSVIEWFNQLPYNLGVMVGQIIGYFLQWGVNLVNFVTVDIPTFINGIIAWFMQLPGRIWEQLVNAWNFVITWGGNMFNSAVSSASRTIEGIISWFAQLPGRIWSWLCSAVSNVYQWGSNLWSAGVSAAGELVTGIIDKVSELPGKLVDVGVRIIEGLWEGIGNMKDWILDKISDFCDGIAGGILDFFGIHSPSRLMRDMVGKMLPPGIAIGFEMAMPKSTKDILNEVDGMSAELQKEVNAGVNNIGVPLETNAKISQQQSVVNAFPKSMELIKNGVNEFKLVLENGAELAHFIAPDISAELAILK